MGTEKRDTGLSRPTAAFDVIAFDGDDTLWHNETLYAGTQERFQRLLSRYSDPESVAQALYETEMRNLACFGYGIKSFTLSMIETAVGLTGGQIQGTEIQRIVDYAKEMRRAPLQLLEGVHEVVAALSSSHELMIITKGDLLDQETKVARSGLTDHFKHVEIVSEKTKATYKALLSKQNIAPERFLMVGNSLRSDILPVLAIGGQGVYIPYHITWAHEAVADPGKAGQGYWELEHIGLLPDLVDSLNGG